MLTHNSLSRILTITTTIVVKEETGNLFENRRLYLPKKKIIRQSYHFIFLNQKKNSNLQ